MIEPEFRGFGTQPQFIFDVRLLIAFDENALVVRLFLRHDGGGILGRYGWKACGMLSTAFLAIAMGAVLHEIEAFLAASLSGGWPSPPQLSVTLAALLGAYPPADWLLPLARDEEACHALATRSFEHVNGFCKIVLVVGVGDAYKLRLHVWRKGDTDAPAMLRVHNHRWHFASQVLLGSLTDTSYVVSRSGVVMDVWECSQGPGDLDTSYRSAGTSLHVKCRSTSTYTPASANAYSKFNQVFHSARPAVEGETISMVLQGPPILKCSTVLCTSGFTMDRIHQPRTCTGSEIHGVLGAAAASLRTDSQ